MQNNNTLRPANSYAWVIVGVLFFGLVTTFGMRLSFGAYLIPWEKDFEASRTVVSAISFLGFIAFAFGQPLAGKLNDRFGKCVVPLASVILISACLLLTSRATQIWQVFILFGAGFSFGVAGCCNALASAIVAKWFVKKRGLALGITASGMAGGMLALVPLNLYMIERLGWRTTMAALGIVILVTTAPLFIIFLRSKPEEKGMSPYGYTETDESCQTGADGAKEVKKAFTLKDILKSKTFWLIAAPYFVCGFSDVGFVPTHLIAMAEGKGFTGTTLTMAISVVAISSFTGSILSGHLSDLFNRRKQLAGLYLFRGLAYVFLIFVRQPWLLIPFAVAYGLVEMAGIAPVSSMTIQLFEGYSTGTLLGIVTVSHQIGGAVGSWMPGIIYDLTGSYNGALIIVVVLIVGASLLTLRLPDMDAR